ncbi:MAG: hypothetical protein F6K11_03250 [Leptolyngbya sp. SIO3F4]|nr:hypothetical protein [Leptolyngbya sp. SIO3F4]
MKVPSWAIVIGVFMMLVGGCNLTNHLQSVRLPQTLEKQQEMMDKFQEISREAAESHSAFADSTGTDTAAVDTTAADTLAAPITTPELFENLSETVQEVFTMSEFSITWMVRFGYIGLFVCVLYILAGAFLLIGRAFSIRLVFAALLVSMTFRIVKYLVLASDADGGFFSMMAGSWGLVGVIIDLIFLIILLATDKSDYMPEQKTAT